MVLDEYFNIVLDTLVLAVNLLRFGSSARNSSCPLLHWRVKVAVEKMNSVFAVL